jgi:hypothetical protein
MTKLIYTYALIKSLYDDGADYIDTFRPFILRVLSLEASKTCGVIQQELANKYGLNMPLHVVSTIVERAKNQEYAIKPKRKQSFSLSEKGHEHLSQLESSSDVENRIDDLQNDIIAYFGEQGVSVSKNQVEQYISIFLQQNLAMLIEFINPSAKTSRLENPSFEGNDVILSEYFKVAAESKPNQYKTIGDLIFGSIVSVILYTQNTDEIDSLKNRKFEDTTVYFDTNFIFPLLGIDEREKIEAANELFSLLKEFGFELKVFSFTLDEVTRVLKGFERQKEIYPNNIHINSIYSHLKRNNYSSSDVLELIGNLDKKLESKGVITEQVEIDLKKYKSENADLNSEIIKFKSEQNLFSQNHDVAAIELIKKKRGHSVRRIEDAKYLFLTSDVKLSRFNFEGMSHKDRNTIGEVVLDRLFTSILWLKNPSSNPPLKSIISAYSRELFINKGIWIKFCETLVKLKIEQKVSDEQVTMLFYQGHIENTLRHISDNKASEITPRFILEQIEKATLLMKKEKEERQSEMELLDKKWLGNIKNLQAQLFEAQEEADQEKKQLAEFLKSKDEALKVKDETLKVKNEEITKLETKEKTSNEKRIAIRRISFVSLFAFVILATLLWLTNSYGQGSNLFQKIATHWPFYIGWIALLIFAAKTFVGVERLKTLRAK